MFFGMKIFSLLHAWLLVVYSAAAPIEPEELLAYTDIHTRYGQVSLRRHLGSGAYGAVYAGRWGGKSAAVKIAFTADYSACIDYKRAPKQYGSIAYEYGVMNRMQTENGFPKMYFSDLLSQGRKLYVMQLLGKSLGQIADERERINDRPLTAVAMQMLDRIEAVHKRGYVIFDVLPDNFLVHKGKVHLIDLGMALPFRDKTGVHVAASTSLIYGECKTSSFSSVNDLVGNSVSRKDDLERFVYVLMYLGGWELLWKRGARTTSERVDNKIRQFGNYMEWFSAPKMKWLGEIFAVVQKLQFSQDPDYASIRRIIRAYRNGLSF